MCRILNYENSNWKKRKDGNINCFVKLCICDLYLYLGSCYFIRFLCIDCLFSVFKLAIEKTNWWKNQFVFTHQFISNQGYRKNLTRNIEIVNVGSNPARFAFDYDKLILGANWSTGNQGLDMDYQLLRFYHSFMKEGATVLIPIVPFLFLQYIRISLIW